MAHASAPLANAQTDNAGARPPVHLEKILPGQSQQEGPMKIDGDPLTRVTHAPPPRPAPRRDSPIPRQPNGPRNNGRFLLTDSRPLKMAEEIVKTAHVPVSFSRAGQLTKRGHDGTS